MKKFLALLLALALTLGLAACGGDDSGKDAPGQSGGPALKIAIPAGCLSGAKKRPVFP